MLEEKLYQCDEIKLNYVEGPDNGPAFLLLPAYDDRWQSYSAIIPQLAANTHLYALDTRGRGKSDRAEEYGLVYSVRDTLGFIQQVIGGPCNVFGHSNGGWIGMWLASERHSLVSSLIVGDSALDINSYIESGKSEDEKAVNQRFMDWAGKPVEELVSIFTERIPDRSLESIEVKAMTFNQVDPEIYKDWVEGRLDRFFDGYNSEHILKNIKCQTLVLQAENGIISLDEVIWARELNEEIKVKQMTGFNHGLGIQDGRETPVVSEIISFLFST
jgi:pimeloyl-ACP methyl ester carboxylesterase